MTRRNRVSYATPHDHNSLNNQITMRDLRRHLIMEHDSNNAHLTNDFDELVAMHKRTHNGHAPAYTELPMNTVRPF